MSATMSYQNLKMNSMLKDAEDKRVSHREKALLVFTFQLLVDKGYFNAASALSNECSLNLEELTICDNIDLHSVFLEFETYYHLRYQRYPQYFKKAGATSATDQLLEKMKANPYVNRRGSGGVKDKKQSLPKPMGQKYAEAEGGGYCATDSKMETAKRTMLAELGHLEVQGIAPGNSVFASAHDDEKLLKPLSAVDFPTEEMRTFAEIIKKDIVLKGLSTKWEDVIGLEDAKVVLKEALVYSKDFTDFFGHGLAPWKGLLMFGPPGVGKTMLAKAVATECSTTFFNVSSSSIVSKWRGDSEKIVKVLFDLAKYYAPSTVFFDEFDALGSSRDNAGESDASRRLKSELLQQMDGILSANSNQHHIFILAATNMPWELDPAILRRFEKRIYIPLPSPIERLVLLKMTLENIAHNVQEAKQQNSLFFKIDLEYLALKMDCYSGSDLHQIIKEAVVRKYRQLHSQKQQIRQLTIETEDILSVAASIPPTVKPTVIEKFRTWEAGHLSV